jgi:TonB family protein
MFESNPTEFHANARKSFRGLLVSGGLHAAAIGVLVLSHEPVVVAPRPTAAYQRVALVAPPPLPEIRRSITRPRLDAPRAANVFAKERWAAALPVRVLPELDLPVAKLVIAAEAPVSDEVVPPVSPVQLPEPTVRTGVFGAGQSSAADLPAPRPATTIGGFADAATSKDAGGAKPVAQVGAFGSAQSDRSPHGAGSNRPVALTGFGGSSSAQNASTGSSGRPAKTGVAFETTHADVPEGKRRADVRTASFGAPIAVRNGARRRPEAVPANFDRDVEIVSKPRPQYTDEARMLGVEGEVVLEVLFGADGEVRVKRMLRGLGHGLDERAVEAASLINFLPARRDGKAVDIVATVRIQFQLA